MKQNVIILVFVLLAVACSPEVREKIDKSKFARLEKSADEVKISLAANASYKQFGEELKKLSTEIAALKDSTKTDEERELLKAYTDLLGFYRDGHLLWKYKLEFEPFDFVPKGRIYVGQDVEPIVSKYNFPVELNVYKPTQQSWKSLSGDSIQLIWKNADFQHELIKKMTSYH